MLKGAGLSDSIEEPILVWVIGSQRQVIMVKNTGTMLWCALKNTYIHILTPICVSNMTTKHRIDYLVMVIHIQLATQAALVWFSPLLECNPVSQSDLRPFSPPHLSHTRGIISLLCPLITYGPNVSQFWLLLSLMRADSLLRDDFSFPRCFIRRTLELLGASLLWVKATSKHHLSAFVAASPSNAKWCLNEKGHMCHRKSHTSVKLVTCHRCAMNEWREKAVYKLLLTETNVLKVLMHKVCWTGAGGHSANKKLNSQH